MEKDSKIFLQHILDSIEYIEKYSANLTEQDFLQSTQLQDAIIRRIEIMGEAAKNLSDEFKENHHEVPWYKIIGMRNELIHGYFGIDVKVVWDTVKKGIPELKRYITGLL